VAVGFLRLPPSEFWQLTPMEFDALWAKKGTGVNKSPNGQLGRRLPRVQALQIGPSPRTEIPSPPAPLPEGEGRRR